MNWMPLLFVAAIIILATIMKRTGQISAGDARALLQKGALVIDVRSPGEFSAGHLPMSVNIPLNEIETALPGRVPDKNKVLLLYCASGMRSGMAKKKLNGMGYANAFNLGSYGRAESILMQQP